MAKNLLRVWPKLLKIKPLDGNTAPYMLALYSGDVSGRKFSEEELKFVSVEAATAITDRMLGYFGSPKYLNWVKKVQKTINGL